MIRYFYFVLVVLANLLSYLYRNELLLSSTYVNSKILTGKLSFANASLISFDVIVAPII